MLRYVAVAERVSQLIEAGTLTPGDKVPSVRDMAHQCDVSITTVVQAYRHLENRGVIEARPQSGYYVLWTPSTRAQIIDQHSSSSAPHPVHHASLMRRLMRDLVDPKLVPLGAAVPAAESLPTAKLLRAVGAMGRRSMATIAAYEESPNGLLALRRVVARRLMDLGATVAPDDIVITCGGQEAILLALRAVTKPGDLVALDIPTYQGVLQAIESLGLRVVPVASHPVDGLDIDSLRGALATYPIKAVFTVSNFSNPLGAMIPAARKRELVALLAERNIPLIEDDIYGDLPILGVERPTVAKAYDTAGNVILVGSFSKTLAPGFRIGFVVGGRHHEAIQEWKLVTNICSPSPNQLAIADFLENGGYEHHLRRTRRLYTENLERIADCVRRHFPAGTRISEPQGGFVLWAELPLAIDTFELYERALRAGIAFAPGRLFTHNLGLNHCLRLSAARWNPSIEAGVARLGDMAKRFRSGFTDDRTPTGRRRVA